MTFVMEKELLHSEGGVQKGNDPAILYAWEHVPISLYPPSNTLFIATTLQTVLHKDGDRQTL